MRRRIQALSERNQRAIDRGFVILLVAVSVLDLSMNSRVEGPLWLNLAVLIGISLSFEWRRSRPLVTFGAVVGGLTVMSLWLR